MSWPVSEGRYKVGNPESPVAVCTMATMELELPMEKIAISGKCVTENIGLEKIIKNIISNPKLRFLVLCGRISNGHYVGQVVKCLVKDGVDGEKRIIGAKGGMPILKNLTEEEIERFRKQIEPVDLIGITDVDKIMDAVRDCWQRNPGPMEGGAVSAEAEREVEKLVAEEHLQSDWVQDPAGFFLIHPDFEKGGIVAEHFDNEKKPLRVITGKSAESIYHLIARMGLVTRHDHAAYLGRELAKAEQALRNNMEFEQDRDLIPRKPAGPVPSEPPELEEKRPLGMEKEDPLDPDVEMRTRTFTISGGRSVTITEPFRRDEKFDQVIEHLNLPKRRF